MAYARSRPAGLVVSLALSTVRLALGGLWLHEGIFKYTAHFGRADILLVADGVKANTRVPHYFTMFAEFVLHRWPGAFGFVVPLSELSLGVALILGVLTLPAALASSLMLMTYWSSDQLIAQYPVMGVLSVVILVWPTPSARVSVTSIVAGRQWPNPRIQTVLGDPLRRWL